MGQGKGIDDFEPGAQEHYMKRDRDFNEDRLDKD